jgi:hypothetical protein
VLNADNADLRAKLIRTRPHRVFVRVRGGSNN